MATRFEWDPNKDRANRPKHGGISFALARLVFDDPLCISFVERIADGEQRWRTIGTAEDGGLILAVTNTFRLDGDDEVIRIISARKATPSEREDYEEARY